MTEPLDVSIQSALCARLASPALTSPATPIAWPLVDYTPTPGTKYLDVHPVLRAATQHISISFDGSDLHRGVFQVDVVAPKGEGAAPALRIAALVVARFEIGTELVAGSQRLQITGKPSIATAVTDAPWVRFPVSIPYLVIE